MNARFEAGLPAWGLRAPSNLWGRVGQKCCYTGPLWLWREGVWPRLGT